MANTHYYGFLSDAHGRGPSQPTMLDPIGGMSIVTTGETQAAVVNTIIRAPAVPTGSGAVMRVTRLGSAAGDYDVELLVPNQPIAGETLTYDSGGTATMGNTVIPGVLPGGALDGTWQPLVDKQYLGMRKDVTMNTPIPNDGTSDRVFWDRWAKLGRQIDVTGVTGTYTKGERYQLSGGATFTVLKATDNGSGNWTILVMRVTGTLAETETISAVTAGATGDGTLGTLGADTTAGELVPLYHRPNWDGAGTDYERTPLGTGAPDLGARFGAVNTFTRAAWDFHQEDEDVNEHGVRIVPVVGNDGDTSDAGNDGGVYLQKLEIAGLTQGWTRGETITVAATGFSAKLVDFTSDALYFCLPNGVAISAADVIVGQTSGETETADGQAIGWAKGSKFWDHMVSEFTAAQADPNALWNTQEARWEALAVWIWEGEVSVFAFADLAQTDAEDWRNAWEDWIADLRSELHADLKIAILRPQQLYQYTPAPVAAALAHDVIVDVANRVDGVSFVSSNDFQREGENNATLVTTGGDTYVQTYIRPEDHEAAGKMLWRSIRFLQYVPPTGALTPLPVFLTFGQSQGAGLFNTGAIAATFDNDPDLYSSATFPGVSTLDTNVYMWNAQVETLEWQPFDVAVNASTFEFLSPLFSGLHCALALRMKKRFGDGTGSTGEVGMINLNVGGSVLHWQSYSGFGCWHPDNPGPDARDVSVTVSVLANPSRGRFTGAAGDFTGWATSHRVNVTGSALGNLGAGGNNHSNGDGYTITNMAGDGSWIELTPNGTNPNFVAETASLTFKRGPKRLVDPATDTIRAAKQQCVSQLNRIPRAAGIILYIGETDAADENHANFAASQTAALDWIHEEFAPKLPGETPCPTVIVGLTQRTPVGSDTAIATIKAAQEAEASTRSNCSFVDSTDWPLDSNGTWPRVNRQDNGIHLTLRGSVMSGYHVDAAFDGMTGIPSHPDGAAAVDFGADSGSDSSESSGDGDSITSGDSLDSSTASESSGIIDAIDTAVLEGGEVASYTVNGRTVTMRGLDELLRARKYYESLNARARGLRFTKASFN
jgi:hypothetical protein